MHKTTVVILSVLVLVSPCMAAQQVDELEPVPELEEEALPAELVTTIESFYSSVESGDVEGRIALFSDDIVMMPNHWTVSRGIEPVAAMFRSTEGTVFRIRDREVLKASCSGNVAYTVNSYYYTYHAEGDEPQWHKTKNVHIWGRDPEGAWKLELDIWNSDVPMSVFADE